jgi:hypothetical protein
MSRGGDGKLGQVRLAALLAALDDVAVVDDDDDDDARFTAACVGLEAVARRLRLGAVSGVDECAVDADAAAPDDVCLD